jgi:hypothetical protein
MAYFIFSKNLNDVPGTLYAIAENESDLNNLNINKPDYKIIEDNQINFDNVKYGLKIVEKYNNDSIIYIDKIISFKDKNQLSIYVVYFKNIIKQFTENNTNHPLYNLWNNYFSQLNNLNLDNITYPLNKSLEQYFKDINQPSLHPLQIP